MYIALKYSHEMLAGLSLCLFTVRGMALLMDRPLRQPAWRRLPPAVDTLLLACGIGLAVALRIDPLHTPWLGVKLLCVVLYIGLGILAFRLQAGRIIRLALFLAALLVFGFIVSIAFTHDPKGIFVSAHTSTEIAAP